MEITQVYAIATGGIFTFLILVHFRPYMQSFLKTTSLLVSQYLTYPQLIRRHRYLGPWSWADVLLQLFYITVNAFCVGFKVQDIQIAGLRAANLSLINIIPLFAGPHLNFLADILGVSLNTYRRVHRSVGIMSFVLLLFHVLTVMASRNSFPLRVAENMWGVIVSLIPSSPFL